MCFGPIISCKSAAAFCGSKAKFPGGFPARSRKSSKMFGKFLSCSHATEEYCWFARPVNPFGGCRRWMESGFRSPWITGVQPIAVTGNHGIFPIVCRVDNYADATNSFTTLTVDFETMTAHWAESGSCVYSKAGTRQTHLAAVERAGGNRQTFTTTIL